MLLQNGRSIGLKVETKTSLFPDIAQSLYCESMKAIYLDEDSRVIDARVFSIGILETHIPSARSIQAGGQDER